MKAAKKSPTKRRNAAKKAKFRNRRLRATGVARFTYRRKRRIRQRKEARG